MPSFTLTSLSRWRWQSNRYVVLKINTFDSGDKEGAEHELNLSRRLAETNPSHEGFPYVRTIIDSFEIVRQNSTYPCLVFAPLREPLWRLQRRFKNHRFSLVLLKTYMELLLRGLGYIRSECHVVHTGECVLRCDLNVC